MPKTRPHRGAVLIYAIIAMAALLSIVSLAVDLGRVELAKTALQSCADATARGSLQVYQTYGQSTANSVGPTIPANNPVDDQSAPTVSITWGWWDSVNHVFHTGSGSNTAVKVIVSRTAANRNAIPLLFAGAIGLKGCDVSATAIAFIEPPNSASNVSVSGMSDPWLAGMPNGSTASYDDTAPAESPTPVSITVTPGQYVTFTNVSGAVAHDTTDPANSASGDSTFILSHGLDSPGGPTPAAENGIADTKMPIDALLGVFLTSSSPNNNAAPSTRDYTSQSSRDQTTYDDIAAQQPFYIGDGQTSGGTVQQFRVPDGATRLFLGTMDGHEWSNNRGSFTVTVTGVPTIQLVQ